MSNPMEESRLNDMSHASLLQKYSHKKLHHPNSIVEISYQSASEIKIKPIHWLWEKDSPVEKFHLSLGTLVWVSLS